MNRQSRARWKVRTDFHAHVLHHTHTLHTHTLCTQKCLLDKTAWLKKSIIKAISPKQLTALSVSVLHTDRVELGVFLTSGNWCFQNTKKNHIVSRLRSINSHCFLSCYHLCSLIKTNFLKGQFNFVIPLPTELSQSDITQLEFGLSEVLQSCSPPGCY